MLTYELQPWEARIRNILPDCPWQQLAWGSLGKDDRQEPAQETSSWPPRLWNSWCCHNVILLSDRILMILEPRAQVRTGSPCPILSELNGHNQKFEVPPHPFTNWVCFVRQEVNFSTDTSLKTVDRWSNSFYPFQILGSIKITWCGRPGPAWLTELALSWEPKFDEGFEGDTLGEVEL